MRPGLTLVFCSGLYLSNNCIVFEELPGSIRDLTVENATVPVKWIFETIKSPIDAGNFSNTIQLVLF